MKYKEGLNVFSCNCFFATKEAVRRVTLKSCQFRLGQTQLGLEIVGQGVVVLNPVLLGLHHSRLALGESKISSILERRETTLLRPF